jgi:lysine-N-methylase
MKIRVPEYFVDFKCIADKCLDSCCIGWEIDIDERTRAKYDALDTTLGAEIREKTVHGYFPLRENGRCAFLDDTGLCRIISAEGDGCLCDICREHPRFYGVGNGIIEGGLGLGCEEAARMTLALTELPKLIEIDREIHYEDADKFADVSEYFRSVLSEDVFALSANELISKYKAYATVADDVTFQVSTTGETPTIPKLIYTLFENEEIEALYQDFLSILSECEYMSNEWPRLLDLAKEVGINQLIKNLDGARGLLYYFTHRYVREGVEDMSLGQRILFALLSTLTVCALSKVIDKEEKYIRAAVLYSKNIEYSTDNVDMILDALSEFL